jgi:hypothetical protein
MASLTRWDPLRDLMGIQSELNRLVGRQYGARRIEIQAQA